jgi:hypothetical protein
MSDPRVVAGKRRHQNRALNPTHPTLRGTAQAGLAAVELFLRTQTEFGCTGPRHFLPAGRGSQSLLPGHAGYRAGDDAAGGPRDRALLSPLRLRRRARRRGRHRHHGASDARSLRRPRWKVSAAVAAVGRSGAPVVEEAIQHLNSRGRKTGVLKACGSSPARLSLLQHARLDRSVSSGPGPASTCWQRFPSRSRTSPCSTAARSRVGATWSPACLP